MADDKVIIQLTLDDSQVKKVSKALPGVFDDAGTKSGAKFSSGLKRGLSGLTSVLTSPFKALSSQLLGIGTAIAGGFLFKRAIDEAKTLENGLIGLTTVTNALGGSVSGITTAAKELSADGLIPLGDVTSSLKSLVANFDGDINKAVSSFKSLRDAAAFNRQESLSLGEAIRGASEGLKNDLSIKVDNAGITKNLSILQKEYATEIGKTVGKLTEAEKAQAEYLGIQREGAIFQGDYNRLLGTFSGAVSNVSGSFRFLLASFGSIITRSPLVIEAINKIADGLKLATIEIEKFAANDGFRRFALGAVEVGRAINDYIIKPTTAIVDTFNIVQKGVQVFVSGMIALYSKLYSFIAAGLNALGVDNKFTQFLQDVQETSFDVFKEKVDSLKETMDGAFGFEASEKVSGFFDNLNTKILETSPNLNTLGSNLSKPVKGAKELGVASKNAADAVNKSLNQAVAKTASQGIQSLTKSLLAGEAGFSDFGKAIAGTLGAMAVQLGETLILSGIGIEALKSLGGTAAIAAGAGLIALGTILSSFSGGSSTTSSGGSASTPIAEIEDETIIGDEPEEREEANTQVVVNVQGDILDTDETGSRIIQIINDTYDKSGVVINSGVVA